MSEKNRKLKKQSAHRNKAEGVGWFSSAHVSKKEKKQELSSKKERSKEVKEGTREERKLRIGRPQPPYLGNRTRTDRGREGYGRVPNRLAYLYEWSDPSSGSKTIREFQGETAKAHLVVLIRIFLNDNFDLYDDEWRFMILKYLILTYNFSPKEVLTSFKTRALGIKNNKVSMEKAVSRFGPAFLPCGFVVRDGQKEMIHHIPIKGGFLSRAQARFAELQIENVREVHRALVSPVVLRGGMQKPENPRVNSSPAPKDVPNTAKPEEVQKPKGKNFERNQKKKQQDKTKKLGAKAPTNEKTESLTSDEKVDEQIAAEQVAPTTSKAGSRSDECEKFRKEFQCKKKLTGITRHKVSDLNQREYLDLLTPVECLGNPWCGYVAIDLCMGVEPSFDRYKANAVARDLAPYDCGEPHILDAYCQAERNCNLLIVIDNKADDDEVEYYEKCYAGFNIVEGVYSPIYRTLKHDESEWVVLLYVHNQPVGHFVPLVGPKTREVMPLPEPQLVRYNPYFFQFFEEFKKVTTLVDPSLVDRRAPQVRREKIEIEDTYSRVELRSGIVINPIPLVTVALLLITYFAIEHYRVIYEKELLMRTHRILFYINVVRMVLGFILLFSRIPFRILSFGYAWCWKIFIFLMYLAYSSTFTEYVRFNTYAFLNNWRTVLDNYYCLIAALSDFYRTTITVFVATPMLSVTNDNVVYDINYGRCHNSDLLVVIDWKQRLINALLVVLAAGFLVSFTNRVVSRFFRKKSLIPNIKFSYEAIDLVVSNGLAQVISDQLSVIKDLNTVDWSFLTRTKWLGTNRTENDGIVANTKAYILYVVNTNTYANGLVPRVRGNRGLVAINTDSSSAFISAEQLATIARNQIAGKVRGCGNFVKKFKFSREPVKSGRPLAVAPIGSPISDQGPLGPGLLPVTDQIGVLAAFCGRSMIYEEPADSIIDEFVEFSKSFLLEYIEGTDCTELTDVDPVEFFRSHYHGKRSLSWIEGQIRQFQFWDSGLADISFDTHSCFVKLENSAKAVRGGFRLKPRLIMTMSPVMLFKCCRILAVVERWNKGPFSRFQIKDMGVEEMIGKIMSMSDKPHVVTDYSSFESSIMGRIRTIENFVIESLLVKAGMHETLADFLNYVQGPRELVSNGIRMAIDSRCSGDPHTSCGNGIVNVCIAAFCATRGGVDLSSDFIIAEGDDGLMPQGVPDPETIRRIGFKFSEEVSGFYAGDTDFLRRRWIDGKVYLNIGRSMSIFWVKTKSNLTVEKQLFILRCMGCSLHHMSPGHPVLFAIVNRIGIETAGVKKFKNWFLHIDMYKWPDFDIDNYPNTVTCDATMRAEIEKGAIGFPPIDQQTQIELEDIFHTSSNLDIGGRLNQYEEVLCYIDSLVGNNHQTGIYSESILELLRIVS